MKSVAIIGASTDRAKFGNKAVRAFSQKGYTVYPINPKETDIEGLPAFKSILDLPSRPNLISVYLPPPLVRKLLPDIAAKGCDELWLNPRNRIGRGNHGSKQTGPEHNRGVQHRCHRSHALQSLNRLQTPQHEGLGTAS